MTPTIDRNNY
jgi:hypothetical protein